MIRHRVQTAWMTARGILAARGVDLPRRRPRRRSTWQPGGVW